MPTNFFLGLLLDYLFKVRAFAFVARVLVRLMVA